MNNNHEIKIDDGNIGLKLKNGVVFEKEKIYKKLHCSNLLDKRLEDIKNFYKSKYDIFYFSMQVIDAEKKYLFRNLDHDS